MAYSYETEKLFLLDGTCDFSGGWGGGPRGVSLSGTNVERLVCYELGIEQPPLRRLERSIPSFEELKQEIQQQQRLASEGKLKRS